jgi:aldehyde dehydrogenase (NAD+)
LLRRYLGQFFNKYDSYQHNELPPVLSRLTCLKQQLQKYRDKTLDLFQIHYRISDIDVAMREFDNIMLYLDSTMQKYTKWHMKMSPSTLSEPFTRNYTVFQPRGVVLIIADIYTPLNSLFLPLISAIASGNTAALYIDTFTPEIETLRKFLGESGIFDHPGLNCLHFIRDPNLGLETLLQKVKFDFIYVSGKQNICRYVHNLACLHNVPFHSDVMGFCVAVVDKNKNIEKVAYELADLALDRAGQVRDGLDQIYVHQDVYREFVVHFKLAAYKFYATFDNKTINLQNNEDYASIISKRMYTSLKTAILEEYKDQLESTPVLIDTERIIVPTLVRNPSKTSRLFKKPTKGPVVALIGYTEIEKVISSLATTSNLENLYFYHDKLIIQNEVKNKVDATHTHFNHTKWLISNIHAEEPKGLGNQLGSLNSQHGIQLFSRPVNVSMEYGPSLTRSLTKTPASILQNYKRLSSGPLSRLPTRFSYLGKAIAGGLGYFALSKAL